MVVGGGGAAFERISKAAPPPCVGLGADCPKERMRKAWKGA